MTKLLSTLNAFAPRRPNIVACIVHVSLLWITFSKQHEFFLGGGLSFQSFTKISVF